MEEREKEYIKLKFAACLAKIIAANKQKAEENEEKGVQDLKLITSLRKLAASSGVDFATIQKIATGKKNPAWTTTVLLTEGLNITIAEWGKLYDSITEEDVGSFKASKKR